MYNNYFKSTGAVKLILLLLLSLIAAALIYLYRTESRTHTVAKLTDKYFLDNKNHYLPCDKLPSMAEADQIVHANRHTVDEIIKQVAALHRGTDVTPLWRDNIVTDDENAYITFSWGEPAECTGQDRADIEITYPTNKDREVIQKIINSNTFFGVPYNLTNI